MFNGLINTMIFLILFTVLSFLSTEIDNKKAAIPNPTVIEFQGEITQYHATVSVTFNPVTESIYFLENESGKLSEISNTGEVYIIDTLLFNHSDEHHFIESKHSGEGIIIWEKGLGEVYEYDLGTKTLEHISDTSVEKLMYFHGGSLQ